MNKTCSKCQEDKPIEEFVKDVYASTGYKSHCKKCVCAANRRYRELYPGKHKMAMSIWGKRNGTYLKAYRDARKGRIEGFKPKGVHKGRTRKEARAFMKEFKIQYDIDNKVKNSEYHREKRVKRGAEMNARARARNKERRRTDPQFRIMERLRHRMKFVTKKQGTKRLAKYNVLFGCSLDVFRKWIEDHFEFGMTWENWGLGKDKWNLDHHYPCSAFDLTDVGQQRQCFHYTNTYPMWCLDNFSKNAKIPVSPRENLLIPDFAKSKVDKVECPL